MSVSLLTLLTDFGTRDGYVGAIKGVLLTRCPEARLVDLTHDIPPGEVDAGAYVLSQTAPFFPAGTVHLAVVDPGVGSARRPVAVEADRHRFVAPDNGLLTLVLGRAEAIRAHSLENSALWQPEVSAVFHGRDLFAPVAAHLAAGGDLDDVGPGIDPASLVRRPWPPPGGGGSKRTGIVVYVDGFGNLVTNLPVSAAEVGRGTVWVAGRQAPMARTYSDVAPDEMVAIRGSSGLLEVACNGCSAVERLGTSVGCVITWHLRPGS